MKKILILMILMIVGLLSFSQTTEEWTKQKKTRIKRLIEQIAANRVYIEYLQKGYKIVTGGLHTIRDIKNGEFRLHINFFDSLKTVNPRIKSWVKVADIIACQIRIVKSTRQALQYVRESNQFTDEELDYCKKVFDNMLEECVKNIDELMMVITSGELTMSDDERLRRIEKLFVDMQEKSGFTASFSNEMSVLAVQRITEQTEIDYSKKISR
jgi:hypothetical protein